MRTLLLVASSIVVLAGAPIAAADEPPSVATVLCSPAPNPVDVGFGALSTCSATAECDPFTDVSCSVSAGTTSCSSADRNCSAGRFGQRGFVTCNGSTTYCGGQCCGSDGVCEYAYGCGCADPDCASLPACNCSANGTCNPSCGCPSDPDCCTCTLCSSITNCTSDAQCSKDCPGSICTFTGICLCAG